MRPRKDRPGNRMVRKRNILTAGFEDVVTQMQAFDQTYALVIAGEPEGAGYVGAVQRDWPSATDFDQRIPAAHKFGPGGQHRNSFALRARFGSHETDRGECCDKNDGAHLVLVSSRNASGQFSRVHRLPAPAPAD